jgi:hypothetical protein
MNIALILSTLIIGASVNPTGDSSLIAPPTSDLPLPPIQNNSAASQTQTRSAPKGTQQHQTRATRSSGYSGRSQQQNAQNAPLLMPIAPTDSSAGSQVGHAYQFLPPTANAATAESAGGGGSASGLSGPMSVPTSPTRARPGEAQSYTSLHNAEVQNQRSAATRNAASAPAQLTPKAFSGVTPSSSGSSPYMNIFRGGSNNGTIDNYTTLVRPDLEQQRANQKFGADIHGLENSTHVQGLNIRQLNRDTQTLQGVNATQYFMNYGDYFQGAR